MDRLLPLDASIIRRGYSVRGLANWILDYATELRSPITNMALNKLVYFAYERALVVKRIVLTDSKIEAWDHGPVFREVYQAFRSSVDKPINDRASFYYVPTGKVEVSTVEMIEDDESFLREILKDLVPLSASKLRELSHVEGGAWHRVWCYKGYVNPGMEIYPHYILDLSVKD